MASKVGRMKKWCEKYKSNHTREDNKRKKQERHEAKVAHFAKRAEEGKTYEWKPNSYKQGTDEWRKEECKRANDRYRQEHNLISYKDAYSAQKSIDRRVKNDLDVKAKLAKEAEIRKRHNKNRGNEGNES